MRVPRVFRPTPRLSPECSRLMEMLGIAIEDFLAEDNVSRVSREEGVRFQNPLLVKKVRWGDRILRGRLTFGVYYDCHARERERER